MVLTWFSATAADLRFVGSRVLIFAGVSILFDLKKTARFSHARIVAE